MHVSICIIYDNSVHLEHLTEYVSFFILFKWCSGCFARVDSGMHIRLFFSSSFKFVNSIINWLVIELGDGFFSSSSLQLIHWWILCVVTIRRELLHCTAPLRFDPHSFVMIKSANYFFVWLGLWSCTLARHFWHQLIPKRKWIKECSLPL